MAERSENQADAPTEGVVSSLLSTIQPTQDKLVEAGSGSSVGTGDAEMKEDASKTNGVDATTKTELSNSNEDSTDTSKVEDSEKEDPAPQDDAALGGDESEGEDIDLFTEKWRDKYHELRKRIKMTPKRAKQMYQYASIMEERVTFLEERCNDMAKRLKMKVENAEDDEDENTKKQRPLKFALNPQLWQEFKALPAEDSTIHVIDILVEEPEYLDGDSYGPGRRILKLLELEDFNSNEQKSKERNSQATAVELTKAVESLRGNRLPERVRFNSLALQHLLRKHFVPGGSTDKVFTDPGYIMLRPYKSLLHFEDEIRGLWTDLLKILDNMRLTGNSQEVTSTEGGAQEEGAQDGTSEEGKPSTQEGTTKENNSKEANRESEVTPEQVPTDATKSGCEPDPNQPMPIDKDSWSNIFKRLGLYHCDDCSQFIVTEWPTDREVRKTFECFFEFFDSYLKPIASRLRQREAAKVRFADLWHLFRSDDEIVTKRGLDNGTMMAMRVLRTNGGRRHIHPGVSPPFDSTPLPADRVQPVNGMNPFSVHAWYIDFDGTSLSPVRRRFVIQPYTGERSITDLDVYPIKYAKDPTKLKETLIDRGKKFVKFATAPSASYCECKGEELGTKEELNDKVIVDMKEYGKDDTLPSYTEPDALDMSETSTCDRGLECTLGPECYHTTTKILHDQYTDKTAMKDYVAEQPLFQHLTGKENRDPPKLQDNDYAICTYRLFAYKLRSRDWVEIHIDSVQDATVIDEGKGFERLVLPPAHKHIIKSQVKEHFRKKSVHTSATQDDLDLVRGKGQGLIILLHGAPGVGKTCTAETIADLVHKPLYPITCGDLGSTAKEVEENLKEHFTLASRWDCVMLLDEADVFLAKRRSEDLQRNSIVSVFLRIMEYYKGLLFLTTNRVGTFDEAFKSRVHISLFYADFDQKTTIKVWKTFIRQTKEAIRRKRWTHFKVRTSEILEFAQTHWAENPKARWNGRQIRNAFHTAIAMAEFDARAEEHDGQEPAKIVLGSEQFAKIASTVRDFDKYMIETMGTTFEEKADKEKLRKLRVERGPEKGEAKKKDGKKKGKKVRYESESESEESDLSEEDDEDEEEEEEEEEEVMKGKKKKKGKKGKAAAKNTKSKNAEEESESDNLSSDEDD
ncbi:hypothetical protein BDV95DRAFT_606882 [Massariosphaeria phaeospora]|uniref:AAA+ ATPase domain-containing protein n=1 Tax=Massariosphaeria phaeospora TaxID=100035 RepID=A0A7C8M5T3_9PLEO|nr:hypothetical protein BDV95DRAFT_606882 [Massariosphaeria phaeospora]